VGRRVELIHLGTQTHHAAAILKQTPTQRLPYAYGKRSVQGYQAKAKSFDGKASKLGQARVEMVVNRKRSDSATTIAQQQQLDNYMGLMRMDAIAEPTIEEGDEEEA